jgi:hypothetical protein
MCRRIAVAVALTLWIGVGSAHATIPGENGRIAFTSSTPTCCDIHTVVPSPDPLQRQETNLTPGPAGELDPAWSPDGSRIAYSSTQSGQWRIWVMNQDGSGKTQLSPDPVERNYVDTSPAWSPDGSKIAWHRDRAGGGLNGIYIMDSDGANPHRVVCCGALYGLDYSPDGTKLLFASSFDGYLYISNADGTAPVKVALGGMPSWSPSQYWIGYINSRRVALDGSVAFGAQEGVFDNEWSPDGRLLAGTRTVTHELFVREEGVESPGGVPASGFAVAESGSDPDWESLPPFVTPPGYPRPRGAGPMDISLVPAYEACEAPNTEHGSPLSFGSCAPPVQSSANVTVGTPDANEEAARFVGRARLTPLRGDPTPGDDADVRMTVSVSDVRCRVGGIGGCDAPLADYSASLRGTFDLTITDKDNGGSGVESATVKTIPFWQPAIPLTVPCVPTPDPAVGSSCALATTAEAIAGNVAREGKRATWAIGRIQLWDAGEDGNLSTDDNTLFATQGLFVP